LPPIVPQVSVPVPQPLPIVPQFLPVGHVVSGVQLVAQVPFEQTMAPGHPPPIVPQLTLPPHWLGIVPQLRVPQTSPGVAGAHPQTFATDGIPPAQLCGGVQVPQSKLPPHPSGTVPQFLPEHAVALVIGVQPHTLATPPPLQVWGATQALPHATACPQLLGTLPHLEPFWQVVDAGSGRQPHTPFTPPPPQVAPVPAQLGEQLTMWLQLFEVGPHLPPMHVVAMGSSTHAMQAFAVQPSGQTVSEPHWPFAAHV
jgi:hypothetical protein